MSAIKTQHTETGYSEEYNTLEAVMYYADFTTGSGVGSAQLQVKIAGDWVPASAAVAASMTNAVVVNAARVPLTYRWKVTRSAGTIYTYVV